MTGRSNSRAASERGEVVGPALERELLSLELARPPGAAEIDEDEHVPGPEAVSHAVPERARQAEPVEEHDGDTFPYDLDMSLERVDDNVLLSHPCLAFCLSLYPITLRARRHAVERTASTIACTDGA